MVLLQEFRFDKNRINVNNWLDWYLLWFDQREFYPFAANCFIENMQLQYNVTSHIYQEPKGEYVRIPDYGGMDSCNFIDSNHSIPIWNTITYELTTLGYEVKKMISFF